MGDSRSTFGKATGGGNDRIDGHDGYDSFLIGDSFTNRRSAEGAGDDHIDSGIGTGEPELGATFLVGDNYSNRTATVGGGDDRLIVQQTGAGEIIIGDNRAQTGASAAGSDWITGGRDDTLAPRHITGDNVVTDSAGIVTGGGDDRIDGMGGDDTMFGDSQRGGGPVPNSTDDRCDGGPGTDVAIDCKRVIGVP